MMPAALRLTPGWNGYCGMVAMNFWISACTGTNNHIWSPIQRVNMLDSWRAVSNGSAFRLVIIGQLVTSRVPLPTLPLLEAKLIFQSFQRSALRSPACPK
ncbi:hypothetical protein D3C78_1710070 [compost metagenome]